MSLRTLRSVTLCLSLVVGGTATTSGVCQSFPYNLVLPFSTFSPALSFCSSKYPVAPVTTTTTYVPTQTSVASTTIFTTVAATTTSTNLVVDTVTVTYSVPTANPKIRKRRTMSRTHTSTSTTSSQPTGAQSAESALWSSITSQLGAELSTACSCIEKPTTVTATQTAPTTVESTRTVIQTASLISTIVTTVSTTTTATCSIQTYGPDSCTNYNGGAPLYKACYLGHSYAVDCCTGANSQNGVISSVPGSSIYDCINACDVLSSCVETVFNHGSNLCTFYSQLNTFTNDCNFDLAGKY